MKLRGLSPFSVLILILAVCPSRGGAQGTFTLETLRSFTPSHNGNDIGRHNDGGHPSAGMIQGRDGNFYGTTSEGGPGGNGTVFRLSPGGVLTVLHGFSATDSRIENSDGNTPSAGVVQAEDGNFYGTTYAGGSHGAGTFFRLTSDGILATLYNFGTTDDFGMNSDGAGPIAGIIEGNDGNFYGTAGRGGANGDGTIFRLTPSGVLTTLYTFKAGDGDASGAEPQIFTGLTLGRDGNFYGTTTGGGTGANGTIYRLTPAGVWTMIYSFGATNDENENGDGAQPVSELVLGADGNFYGTTRRGGTDGAGTIFQLTPAGTLTTLHSITTDEAGGGNDTDAGLIMGNDGNLYGTTLRGGVNQDGSIYQCTPAGVFSTLFSFGGDDDYDGATHGEYPAASLLLGQDGNFYGTTNQGGTGTTGTIFRLTSNPATVLPVATLVASTPFVSAGNSEPGAFTLGLSAPAATDVVINLLIQGDAVNGKDYALLKTTKKIKAGRTSKLIKIVPQGNLGGKVGKTVKLSIAPGNGYILGTTEVKVEIFGFPKP